MAIPIAKLVALPGLGLGILGISLMAMDRGYYVSNTFGDRLDNYHFYKSIHSQNNNFSLMKGINSKINEHTNRRDIQAMGNGNGEDIKVVKKIEDYSVKLATKCSSGTGWFLDYIIPENGSYPTKWFIATNAHVVSEYRFQNNKYQQVLPTTYFQRGCVSEKETHTSLMIVKDLNNGYENIPYAKDAALWNSPHLKNWFRISREKNFVNAGNNNLDIGKILQSNKLMYSIIKNPNLFYVPINFLGDAYVKKGTRVWPWNKKNYYKDFAVLFVEFENENIARAITNNFHEKYHKKTNGESPLNLFKNELIKDYDGDELIKSDEKYFISGYPGNSYDSYQSFSNYSSLANTASRLTYWDRKDIDQNTRNSDIYIKNKWNQALIGHVNVSKIDRATRGTTVTWAGYEHFDWGYNYLLDSMILGAGASGSLVASSKGDVLGLYRMQDTERNFGFIEPLKSDGLYVDGTIVFPQYDLIKGVKGQKESYKSQLDTYFPESNTFLRAIWNSK